MTKVLNLGPSVRGSVTSTSNLLANTSCCHFCSGHTQVGPGEGRGWRVGGGGRRKGRKRWQYESFGSEGFPSPRGAEQAPQPRPRTINLQQGRKICLGTHAKVMQKPTQDATAPGPGIGRKQGHGNHGTATHHLRLPKLAPGTHDRPGYEYAGAHSTTAINARGGTARQARGSQPRTKRGGTAATFPAPPTPHQPTPCSMATACMHRGQRRHQGYPHSSRMPQQHSQNVENALLHVP